MKPGNRRAAVALVAGWAMMAAGQTVASAASNTLQVGVTHTQETADAWGDPTAVASAKQVLRGSVRLQGQALMGWGALNPEPWPGVRDWRSLDARLDLIRATGGQPVVTLCCAPDWMKGGMPGRTDWSRLEAAPYERHFRAYAALAVAFARRHPDVRHYLVWNELKGFYDPKRNDWDVDRYVRLYNIVYDALKAHDNTLRVGGPYVHVDSWSSAQQASHPSTLRGPWGVADARGLNALQRFLKTARGVDMLVLDGGTATRDAGLITDDVTATRFFTDVTTWLRQRTDKPIWWSEFYPAVRNGATPAHHRAVYEASLKAMQAGGATVAMHWAPEGLTACIVCLWADTSKPTGGVGTPYAANLRRWNRAAGVNLQ